MAGVFEKLIKSHKRAMQCDPKALELETAKEILAEIFGVRISDVDEMILNRFETEVQKRMGCGRASSGCKPGGTKFPSDGNTH
jgi:hypothetical protein